MGYQRDHEIGEGISSENGAGPLAAHSRRQEARDIKDESDIADKSHDISRELTLMHANDQHRLVESAQEILGLSKKNLGEGQEVTATDTDGIAGVALGKEQIKLAGRI